MSLVLLLAAGVYASNRLLTHWLLVRGLEQSYTDKSQAIAAILNEPSSDEVVFLPESLTELRLSLPAAESSLDDRKAKLLATVQTGPHKTEVLDIDIIPPAEPQGVPRPRGSVTTLWNDRHSFHSPRTLVRARQTARNGDAVTAVPDMSLIGEFGSTAIVVYPAASPDAPGAMVLVSTSDILKSLTPLLRSVSAAIGALCLASIVFAGILLWMRFRDQLQTTRNIQYLAHHDTLTGLPNRAVFNARLTEALRLAQAKASNIGVMLIDVDKFKEINDTHGHGTGDVFLQIIADRLKIVFGNHLVARLAGDEFAVMMTSVADSARMTRLASDMISATDAPCSIDGKEIKISLSIGLARATDGSWRASRLLHCADLALYRAKHSGRSTFSWYTPEMDAEAQKRKEIEQGLVKALKFDQLKLKYQPQYALKDGELKGYEALIRWEHPTKGLVRPDLFIPIAEDTGLIGDIGYWVLDKACQEAALWPDKTRRVAVNMSPAQFRAGETHERVARALQSSGLDPSRLEIEITESLLISDTDAVIHTLRQIRDMGVSIAMDDFGTGYSSLSYLSLFPFDKIKIDKAFIQNLGKDAGTDAIVTSIIGLGRSLDVTITAEGVETEDQVILLRAAGCDLVQGYFYGKPDDVSVHESAARSLMGRLPGAMKKTQPTSQPVHPAAPGSFATSDQSTSDRPNAEDVAERSGSRDQTDQQQPLKSTG